MLPVQYVEDLIAADCSSTTRDLLFAGHSAAYRFTARLQLLSPGADCMHGLDLETLQVLSCVAAMLTSCLNFRRVLLQMT